MILNIIWRPEHDVLDTGTRARPHDLKLMCRRHDVISHGPNCCTLACLVLSAVGLYCLVATRCNRVQAWDNKASGQHHSQSCTRAYETHGTPISTKHDWAWRFDSNPSFPKGKTICIPYKISLHYPLVQYFDFDTGLLLGTLTSCSLFSIVRSIHAFLTWRQTNKDAEHLENVIWSLSRNRRDAGTCFLRITS